MLLSACKKEEIKIDVTTPTRDGEYSINQDYEITWTDTVNCKVNITLYDNFFTKIADIEKNLYSLEGQNTYQWTIPADIQYGNNYVILIEDVTDPTHYGYSSRFEILANSFNPKKYDALNTENSSSVFYDSFYNNTNQWAEDISTDLHANFFAGAYSLTNFLSDQWWVLYNDNLTLSGVENYQIEIIIKFTFGNENWGGLLWGYSSFDYKSYYFRTSRSYIYIGEYLETSTDWLNKTIDVTYNSGDYNTLTVRKFKDKYYFFLNQIFIYEHQYIALEGDKICINLGESASMYVDYISLTSINIE